MEGNGFVGAHTALLCVVLGSCLNLCLLVVLCLHQTELEEAADLVLFLMDHTFLADDHLALNETTFTWPDRIVPIIKMRYTCIYIVFFLPKLKKIG